GAIAPGNCDLTDSGTNLTVGNYLIALGVISLTTSLLIIVIGLHFILSGMHLSKANKFCYVIYAILLVATVLAGFAWFIVGAVVLFRGNLDCIRSGSSHVIYALILWGIS